MLCSSAVPAAVGASPPDPAETLTLDGASGYTVPLTVNGVTLRLRVDPGASGIVILNPAAAKLARLNPDELKIPLYEKGRMFRHAFARVGSVEIKGSAATRPALIAGRSLPLRFGWFRVDVVEGADGVISPEHLPYESVTFSLAAAHPDERKYEVSLDYARNIGLYHAFRAGDRVVPIQFSIWKEGNIGTAAAGARLAAALSGEWQGTVTSRLIAFGISRPVRPMALGRPIDLGGFAVDRFLVRTADHRGDLRLPMDAPADPDEIIVTATSPSRQPERLQLILGRSQFAGCSSLRYERLPRAITLRCQARAAVAGSSERLATSGEVE